MRYLITIVIAALSLNAFGQGIPQLPYNPDENGDGLIGVPDLQGLLSQYGLEFNSAVVSDDAESALVYMGEMAHPVCNLACDNLPGFWHMSTMADLGLVWDEVVSSNATTWVKAEHQSQNPIAYIYNQKYYSTNDAGQPSYYCYCATRELPKVEYSYCEGSDIHACAENKVTNGWYPLGGISTTYVTLSSSHIETQAFWRWAE
jgi:hypothetical protein